MQGKASHHRKIQYVYLDIDDKERAMESVSGFMFEMVPFYIINYTILFLQCA